MPEENKEQGESMEGILKSIKNIISGELDKGKAAETYAAPKADEDEILELTNKVSNGAESHMEPIAKEVDHAPRDVLENIDEALGANKKEDTGTVVQFNKESIEATYEEPKASGTEAVSNNKNFAMDDSLLSEQASKIAEDSLKRLIRQAPRQQINSPSLRSGQTLEDLVIEALKPMMADWLNINLPIIVKQIVEKEIKKILPKEE